MGRRAILLAALLLTTPACAEDHLDPGEPVLGTAFLADYEIQVREKLKDAYAVSVEVRMVAPPSFFPEYAVGLLHASKYSHEAPYRIFTLTSAAQIWTYRSIDMLKTGQTRVVVGDKKKEIERLESSVPRNLNDLKVLRCETGIGDELGTRIVEVWRKMLLRTRYSARPTWGTDGTTFHFSMASPILGPLAGKTWSPPRDTATGNLVELANTMRDVCNKSANMAKLENVTAELEHRFK
jgi:hypothetical protein